jgi:hypothetical protein
MEYAAERFGVVSPTGSSGRGEPPDDMIEVSS